MKLYIENEGKYLLLTDTVDKNNLDNDILKEDFINNAMDKLEEVKMAMEEAKTRRLNSAKMLKLGTYPTQRSA